MTYVFPYQLFAGGSCGRGAGEHCRLAGLSLYVDCFTLCFFQQVEIGTLELRATQEFLPSVLSHCYTASPQGVLLLCALLHGP